METTTKTRKKREVRQAAQHIVSAKRAMSAALRAEWELAQTQERHLKALRERVGTVEKKAEAVRAAWAAVQERATAAIAAITA